MMSFKVRKFTWLLFQKDFFKIEASFGKHTFIYKSKHQVQQPKLTVPSNMARTPKRTSRKGVKRIGAALKRTSSKLVKRIVNFMPFGKSPRQIEEQLLRAEATRHHREKLITETIRNGLLVEHTHQSDRIFPELDSLNRVAAEIYISSLLRIYDGSLNMPEKDFVKKVKKEFESLDSQTKLKYIASALLEDPLHSDTVSSDAYLLFVDLHCREQYVGAETPAIATIKEEAADIWKGMTNDQKLPFFLKAYLGTFAPRTLDGAILSPFGSPNFESSRQNTAQMFEDIDYTSEEEDDSIV
jgi:hypothetical protein